MGSQLEIAVKGAQDSAQVSRQSTSDAVTIIRDRLKEGFEELRASVSRTGSGHAGDKPKT